MQSRTDSGYHKNKSIKLMRIRRICYILSYILNDQMGQWGNVRYTIPSMDQQIP